MLLLGRSVQRVRLSVEARRQRGLECHSHAGLGNRWGGAAVRAPASLGWLWLGAAACAGTTCIVHFH